MPKNTNKKEIRNNHSVEDMERWASWTNKRLEGGYRTPTYEHHADIQEPTIHDLPPRLMGFLRDVRVEDIYSHSYDSKTNDLEWKAEPTLVGSIDGLSDEDAEKFNEGLYPNRSLGLRFDEETGLWEIGHLAILPEEVPYHKYTNTDKNTIEDAREKVLQYSDVQPFRVLYEQDDKESILYQMYRSFYQNFGGPGSGPRPNPLGHIDEVEKKVREKKPEDVAEHKKIDSSVKDEIEKTGIRQKTTSYVKDKVNKIMGSLQKPLIKAGYSEKTAKGIAIAATIIQVAPTFPGSPFVVLGGAILGKRGIDLIKSKFKSKKGGKNE